MGKLDRNCLDWRAIVINFDQLSDIIVHQHNPSVKCGKKAIRLLLIGWYRCINKCELKFNEFASMTVALTQWGIIVHKFH